MKHREIIELEGCSDCIMYLANGELPADDDNNEWPGPDAIARIWEGYELCVAGDENSEEYFSHLECDVCRSRLGGNRYPCAAWRCD